MDGGEVRQAARVGKFLSVDPLTASYPWYTPYQFAGNKPIEAIDLDGLEEYHYNLVIDRQNGTVEITFSHQEDLIEYTAHPVATGGYPATGAYAMQKHVNRNSTVIFHIGFVAWLDQHP